MIATSKSSGNSLAARKIRILFVIDSLNGIGGTEKHLYTLIKYLDKERYVCHVIAFSGNKDYVKRLDGEGFVVHIIGINRFYSFDSICKYAQIVERIRTGCYDIVQTFHFFSDTVGAVLARLAGIRNIVSSRRDMGFMKNRANIFANRVANLVIKKFIAVSKAVENEIVRKEWIDKRKIVTIYNGIDVGQFNRTQNGNLRRQLGIGEGDIVLGIVAHLRPEKNHGLLFNALPHVKEKVRNIKCVIVGGWDIEGSRRYCERLGVDEDVIFTGPVDNPIEYISIFDIACLTSTTEGLPNALIEKMAMGKPVIATGVGGNVELVRNKYNGLLVSPEDHLELADAILYLLDNRELMIEMGKRNREIIELTFSIDRMIGLHNALYEGLIFGNEARGDVRSKGV